MIDPMVVLLFRLTCSVVCFQNAGQLPVIVRGSSGQVPGKTVQAGGEFRSASSQLV